MQSGRILHHVKRIHIQPHQELPMYQADPPVAASGSITSWLSRGEAWLDARGRKAWFIAMILGFIVFWPVGLAFLGYMIWSKRMFNSSCAQRMHDRHEGRHGRLARKMERMGYGRSYMSSGNTAFDAYKSDTLKRLEEEQHAFETFLQRLRDAKDKSEFDAFMDDRAKANREADAAPATDQPTQPGTGDY
jgi:Protein of unknown function (DUF2852)